MLVGDDDIVSWRKPFNTPLGSFHTCCRRQPTKAALRLHLENVELRHGVAVTKKQSVGADIESQARLAVHKMPSAVRFFTSELVPWSYPPPPRRPSSPISPCKSRHRCPPVDRLLPPPSRQNNPAQPPRVLFLFQVTQLHSSLPFAAPSPASFPLSQTSPARAYFVQTSCKSRPSPLQI